MQFLLLILLMSFQGQTAEIQIDSSYGSVPVSGVPSQEEPEKVSSYSKLKELLSGKDFDDYNEIEDGRTPYHIDKKIMFLTFIEPSTTGRARSSSKVHSKAKSNPTKTSSPEGRKPSGARVNHTSTFRPKPKKARPPTTQSLSKDVTHHSKSTKPSTMKSHIISDKVKANDAPLRIGQLYALIINPMPIMQPESKPASHTRQTTTNKAVTRKANAACGTCSPRTTTRRTFPVRRTTSNLRTTTQDDTEEGWDDYTDDFKAVTELEGDESISSQEEIVVPKFSSFPMKKTKVEVTKGKQITKPLRKNNTTPSTKVRNGVTQKNSSVDKDFDNNVHTAFESEDETTTCQSRISKEDRKEVLFTRAGENKTEDREFVDLITENVNEEVLAATVSEIKSGMQVPEAMLEGGDEIYKNSDNFWKEKEHFLIKRFLEPGCL